MATSQGAGGSGRRPFRPRSLPGDFIEYLVRLGKQPSGALVALVTFALAVASGIRGHSIGLPAWAWGLLSEGGLVVAGFLDWRAHQKMPDGHAQWLKQIAAS